MFFFSPSLVQSQIAAAGLTVSLRSCYSVYRETHQWQMTSEYILISMQRDTKCKIRNGPESRIDSFLIKKTTPICVLHAKIFTKS